MFDCRLRHAACYAMRMLTLLTAKFRFSSVHCRFFAMLLCYCQLSPPLHAIRHVAFFAAIAADAAPPLLMSPICFCRAVFRCFHAMPLDFSPLIAASPPRRHFADDAIRCYYARAADYLRLMFACFLLTCSTARYARQAARVLAERRRGGVQQKH